MRHVMFSQCRIMLVSRGRKIRDNEPLAVLKKTRSAAKVHHNNNNNNNVSNYQHSQEPEKQKNINTSNFNTPNSPHSEYQLRGSPRPSFVKAAVVTMRPNMPSGHTHR